MKKPIPILLALALTLGLAACSAASPGGEAPEATVHPAEGPAVTGRILDNDGTALLLAGLAQPYDSLYTVSLSALEADARLVLFGHTHVPYHDRVWGMEMINPGSIGYGSKPSYAVVELDETGVTADLKRI